MTLLRLPAVSMFWRTLLLLVIFLLAVQAVTHKMLLTSLRNSPSYIGMGQIADRLAGRSFDDPAGSSSPTAAARLTMASTAPAVPEGMLQDRDLTDELARALHVDTADVRLFYAPEQRRYSPFAEAGRSEPIPHFRGEALFFDGVIAATRRGGTWQVLTMPRSARVIEWERRQLINEATIALVLIAAAFLFARQLAQPLRRFADSADRVGRDTSAPPVLVQGPAELRVAATALNAMQRRIEDVMRERTEMIAAIAHDLRTPLARIAFRVETSAEAIREPVLDDIDQMREMIAEALDFSRAATIDTLRAGRCDLAEVIEGITSLVREFGQEVAVQVPEPLPVNGDALALRRMVQNLVENALKYADNAEIRGTRVNGVVTVEVSDRGPGLPEAMLERVVAPFVRNEPSRSRETGGVGLGLAISKAIAAKHGGDLVLLNRSGGGLTARVTLPALPAEN